MLNLHKIIKEEIKKYLQEQEEDDQHLYPGVEENLPQSLKDLVDQYRELPLEERKEEPLLWWMLKKSTAHFKMSKEGANYTNESAFENQSCNNCQFIYFGQNGFICSQIGMNEEGDDNIQPEGWCKLWKESEGEEKITDKMKNI